MLSLHPAKNDTSLALDALRAIAAQAVCIGHGISFFMPQLRGGQLPLPQNVGVLLFFVLSGVLISYTLVERSKDPLYNFSQFFIDRAARIYSALLPCLLVIAIIDSGTLHFIGDPTIAASYNLTAFIGNLAMIETYRGPLQRIFPEISTFGSASQLWTLVIEWHIYLFVAALFFIVTRKGSLILIPVALFFGQIPTHYILGSLQDDGLGQSLFLLWLGGAAVFFVAQRWLPSRAASLIMVATSICIYFAVTRPHHEYRPGTYPLLLVFVFGAIGVTQAGRVVRSATAVRVIRFFAGYSFTLYLIHHTIMVPAFLLWKDGGWIVFVSLVCVANALAAVLAIFTEMRHKQLVEYFSGFLRSRAKAYSQ